jgi:hypothetical protein
MNTKNLMSPSANRVNPSILQNVAIDLVELSEKDLKRVVGGGLCSGGLCRGDFTRVTVITAPDGTTTITTTFFPCICKPIPYESDSLIAP